MTGLQTKTLMFTLEDAAKICQVDPQVLRNWTANGTVIPAQLGGKGRGRSHQFTTQQVLGISVACWLWDSPQGCRLDYFADTVNQYSKWPWQAVEHCLGLTKSDWSGETFAKALRPEPVEWLEPTTELLPQDRENILRLAKRFVRVREAVLSRVNPGRNRRPAGASKQRA